MLNRIIKALIYLTIFFFTWTMGGLFNVAYAAYDEIQKPALNSQQTKSPEEKLQKALDDIQGIVSGQAIADTQKGLAAKIKGFLETKRSKFNAKRDEIESIDKELKARFQETEKKLINAGLPLEILQRHHKFVQHYNDNLNELRANLDATVQAKTDTEFEARAQKVRNHLEKTSFKKKHMLLDPNKLPHRTSDMKRKDPRTKPEEFLKDTKQTARLSHPRHATGIALREGIEGKSANLVASFDAMSLQAPAESAAILFNQTGLDNTGLDIREYLNHVVLSIINNNTVIPAEAGIQEYSTTNQPLLLASNGPLTDLIESLPKYEKNSAASNPPFLKGNTGGFSTSATEPITLALAHDTPTAADLSETIDVQLTPAIKAKAQELNYSPVKIYNWVRNNVEYVPTYGSIQGADMCLQTMQGNDFDIASLLIALLRASGIHARYVYGTIELPINKVMNWVGGFTDANAAVNFIGSGGTPVAGLISGGKISVARMEHVWVEAYVKYYPLRGAKHETNKGDSWIPLDASFKQYTYTQGIDIKTAVPFDAQAFVNQIQTTATIDTANSSVTNVNSTYIQQQMQNYQTQVKNYIDQNYPNATTGDILGKKEIIKQNFTYLLGTLPYRNAIVGIKYSEIPDNLRHKITFKVTRDIYDESTGTPINITKSLPEIAGKKITLSYSPATANDEAVINSYLPKPHADGTPIQPGELPTSLPAYLINLKPELRIDGVVVATGTTVGMGYAETFDMVFTSPGPSGTTDVVFNQIDAGAYHAIAIDTGKISEVQITTLKTKMEATKDKIETNDFASLSKDDLMGDILYTTALAYYAQLDSVNIIQSMSMGMIWNRLPSESIFSIGLKLETMFGMPRTVSCAGLMMDVDRNMHIAMARDGSRDLVFQFMLTTGQNTSVLEHAVPERLFSTQDNPTQGISAVKALKIANDQGIPIYTINQENINMIMPQLEVSADVKSDIQNAVNAGKVVTVSKTNIIFNGWTGCGYIVLDPTTGAGAYVISGGLNGAFLLALAWAIIALISLLALSLCPSIYALIIINVITSVVQILVTRWIKGWADNPFTTSTGFTAILDVIAQVALGACTKIPGNAMPRGLMSTIIQTILIITANVLDSVIFFFCKTKNSFYTFLCRRGEDWVRACCQQEKG